MKRVYPAARPHPLRALVVSRLSPLPLSVAKLPGGRALFCLNNSQSIPLFRKSQVENLWLTAQKVAPLKLKISNYFN